MKPRRDLSDPDYEPSDDELSELSRAAFAHLTRARQEREARLLEEIARLRKEALERLHERIASGL